MERIRIFDNDSLLHWCIGSLFGWALFGLAIGVPVHLALRIPISWIILFFGAQCILQLGATPWLFAARSTAKHPEGRLLQRAIVVVIWFTVSGVIGFSTIMGWDFGDKTATIIFLGSPVVLGAISFGVLYKLVKHKRMQATMDKK